MSSPSMYRHVPGSSGLFVRKALWFGPDHVLLVTSNVFSEQYRRFYFSDIQAFTAAEIENPARFYGWVLAVISGVLTFALASVGHAIWAMLTLIACGALIVFAVTRSEMRCTLKTQVSTERLPSIKTRDGARDFVAALRQEIEKAQGALPPGALGAHQHTTGTIAPPPLHAYRGGVHWATFALMFAVAALTPIRLTMPSAALSNFLAATHLSMVAVAVVAAVRQHGAALSRVVRTVIAITLAWSAASFLGEQLIVASSIQDAFRNPMAFQYWRDPVRDVAVANAIAYFSLGLVGVLALISQRETAPA